MGSDWIIEPCTRVQGTVRVPGDKSISHRLGMLTALAAGHSTLHGFLASEDCIDTLRAVESLGARVGLDGTTVSMSGTNGRFRQPDGALDLGNSGTGMRLLSGLVAGQSIEVEMTGDASLCARPMARIAAPLREMGASVELTGPDGCAPMTVKGGHLHGIEYRLPVASAQVKSCVLLAGLLADGPTVVHEPRPTRDHTERLLKAMGLDIEVDGLTIRLSPPDHAKAWWGGGIWTVPGDFSSAAFWIVAAAARPGAELRVRDVGLNPRRTALLDVLGRMGAEIGTHVATDAWEPVGDLVVKGRELKGTVVAGDEIPNLIDELPLVAVAGALAAGETEIRDAAELRVKESDRIAAMATGLQTMGVTVEERPDGMRVRGGKPIRGGGVVDSRGDHRVAMALCVLALFADGPVTVRNTACVDTSYPGFHRQLTEVAV